MLRTMQTPDWLVRVDEWLGHLIGAGWHIGSDTELKIRSLVVRLQLDNIEVSSPSAAADWFSPLIAHTAEQQHRLKREFEAWQAGMVTGATQLTPLQKKSAAISASERASTRLKIFVGLAALLVPILGVTIFAGGAFDKTTTPGSTSPVDDGQFSIVGIVANVVLWAIPGLVAWLGLVAYGWRTRVLMRGLALRDAPKEALAIDLAKFALFSPIELRSWVSYFRHHRSVSTQRIDAALSVAATVRQAGRVELVTSRRRVSPEYLLLVDEYGRDDIICSLADLIENLLTAAGVRLERWEYRGDPRKLYKLNRQGEAGQTTELSRLYSRSPDHRVLIVTDATSFSDEDGVNIRPWIQKLRMWQGCCLLTPIPARQWGQRELGLMKLGFTITQATPDGLRKLAEAWRATDVERDRSPEDAIGAAISPSVRATRLERLLSADPYKWLGERPPTQLEQERLLSHLRELLTPPAFLYLQALAVFPLLRPRLTLAIGRILTDEQAQSLLTEETLALLCRLPWLRRARLPDWLRLLLVKELPDHDADRVRHAWATLLAATSSGRQSSGSTIPLEVVNQAEDGLADLVGRMLREDQEPTNFGEALLVAFMNSHSLPPLAVELESSRSRSRPNRERYWKLLALTSAFTFGILGGWMGWGNSSPRLQAISDAVYGLALPTTALLASFVASAVSTIVIVTTAARQSWGDVNFSGPQKFHTVAVPRFGGVSIAIGVSIIYLTTWTVEDVRMGRLLLACCLPVFAAGLIDDLTRSVSPRARMLASIISGGLAFWLIDAGISETSIPLLDWVASFMVGSLALTVFAITGVTHAFNIIDGFNGLASMCAVLILLAIAFVSSQVGDAQILHLTLALVGATLGFFVFNFPFGKIFLGDGGAYLLGFMTATIAILLKVRNPVVSPLFPLLAMIYPIFETLFTIYRRGLLRSRPLSMPDGIHLHSLFYRRLVRPESSFRALSLRNAIASVWMWSICFLSVIPATIWWDSTAVLWGFAATFVTLYCVFYWRIVRFRTPRWMIRTTKLALDVFREQD